MKQRLLFATIMTLISFNTQMMVVEAPYSLVEELPIERIGETVEVTDKVREIVNEMEAKKKTEEVDKIKQSVQVAKKENKPQVQNLGEFKLTAYCGCRKCNGKWTGQPTASGTKLVQGRTIAVDPKVIPLGTKVIINGKTYVAEDTGSAIKGKRIDVYFANHQKALDFGVKYASIKMVKA